MIKEKRFKKSILFYVAILIILPIALNWVSVLPIQKAKAASLTNISDQVSSQIEGLKVDHTIKFTSPTGMAVNKTIVITFPTGYDASLVGATYSYLSWGPTTGLENNCTPLITSSSPTGSNWGISNNGSTAITITSGPSVTPITAGSVIVLRVVSSGGITNPAIPGQYYKVTIGGSFGDTGSYVLYIGSSNIGISANVDPSLAFTMTPTTLLFGTLTTANIRYANDTTGATTIPAQANTPLLTASTNGVSGVLISVYDVGNGTGGLYSSTVSELIPASSVNGLVAGNKKFGVTGLSGSSLTLTPGFSGTSTNGTGTISNVAQSFASSSGPVASGTAAMIMVASIDALTKAGAYTDIVTVVCTGRF